MIIWLASYPRSGNSFFRILLHRLFGFKTHDSYPSSPHERSRPDDTLKIMELVGQPELDCNLRSLADDDETHFVKTHDLPGDDDFPAIVLLRDGRDAVTSYAHFTLRTVLGTEHPDQTLFETTLEHLIQGDDFGGWSRNVEGWIDRVGMDGVIRFEDLIANPVNIAHDALKRLRIGGMPTQKPSPSFQELHDAVPWFFRKGKVGAWRDEMPMRLQELFSERHGHMLDELGYADTALRYSRSAV